MDIFIGKGREYFNLRSDKLNQHGVICGATGSGKTVTLKIICEELSQIGVPTFLSDVKSDLINLSKVGSPNENVDKRLESMGIDDFEYRNYPINIWDVYGDGGLNLRISISELGPLLLSQVLELNDTQEGIINILFRVADEQGLLLLDLKDVNSMIGYLRDHREELSIRYGNIATSSLSAIQRKLLVLEEEGADEFFGEPTIDIGDFLKRDELGNGIINILDSKRLINKPKLYSIFLLYLFSELFEVLPEIGNPEKPVAVFFFDEAHLLFKNMSKTLLEKLNTVVRLIRSKGVGIFFITQNPLDIPDTVSSQLGTKIIHQLRAFSPKEAAAVKEISKTLRENENFDTVDKILNLETGQALVQTLDAKNIPTKVEEVLIRPPHSSFDNLSSEDIKHIVTNSDFYDKYHASIDRESAYEVLKLKLQEQKLEEERIKQEELMRKEQEKREKEEAKKRKQDRKYLDRGIDSMLGTITRTIGREIARGILGSIKRR
ncbi:MAG: DUF853 family protein [Peptoniphilus sp.]|nr:DUF853 family protein [Peptoniphilus sp.]